MFTRLTAIAASITCALALSACSGSSSDSDPGGGGSASKDPIKLVSMGPIDAPNFSLPGIPVGAQVAVDEINKAGGVDGRKLELTVCNDKNDPNTASQCVRQAIKDKAAAFVGGFSLFDPQVNPLLDRAKIPWVGPILTSDFTSSNLFFINGDAGAGYTALGVAMAKGCKNMAVVKSATTGDEVTNQMQFGGKAGGSTIVGTFDAPANGADWAPVVAALKAKNADCITSGTGPAESAAFIAAVRGVDKTIPMGFSSGGLPIQVVQAMKGLAEGVTVVSGYLPPSDPKLEPLAKAVLAQDPKGSLDTFTLAGYAGVKVVAEAAKGLKEVTPATLKEALGTVNGFDTGVGPVVDFTTENPNKGYARIFQPLMFLLTVKGDQMVLAQDAPIDATPGLELLAKR